MLFSFGMASCGRIKISAHKLVENSAIRDETRKKEETPVTNKTAKFLKLFYKIDRQIRQNFLTAGIETRPVNSNGLWCCALLPAILLFYKNFYPVSPTYSLVAYLSLGQFFYSLLFIVFIYISCLILRDTFSAGCIVSTFVTTIPLYFGTQNGLILSLIFSLLAIYPYFLLLKFTLVHCPRTFTVGETMLVSQGIVLFADMTIVEVFYGITRYKEPQKDSEAAFIKTYVLTVIATASLIVTAMYMLKHHRNLKVLLIVLGVGAGFALTVVHISRGVSAIPEFIHYIFFDGTRRTIFFFWLCLLAIAVLILIAQSEMEMKATTEMRKVFHVLASLVFLSGILKDVNFMMLAAGMVFGLLIFVEMIRVFKIEPISEYLQIAFNIYSDEKDCGVLAMTPIYLYVGLACPLVLVPWRPGMELELLSGVLSVGVGDTAASWFGARYGTNKWAGNSRTKEGTAFNIFMQFMVVYVLQTLEYLQAPNLMFRTAVAASASALLEARLQQVDNLVLPPITLLALQATCLLTPR